MNWILDRLREPSTYAGLSGLALALGVSQPTWAAISTAAAAVAALVAVLVSDKAAA